MIDWFVIVNLTSGMGRAKRNWNKIKSLLTEYDFSYEYAFSEYRQHETSLVQNAISKGFKKIICIGGDGTLLHVLNGVMQQQVVPSNTITIGVVPIGTGNDWSRSYDVPRNIEKAIQIIKKQKTILQDVGLVTLLNQDKSTYYNILAGSGFVGHVVHKTNALKKIGPMAFVVGTILSLTGYKVNKVEVDLNEEKISDNSLLIVIGNLKYSGGGMQLTKDPIYYDGLLDVTIAKNISKGEVLANIINLFNGKIVEHKKVENFKTNSVKVTISDASESYVIADGELLGMGSYQVELIPRAVSYIVP